MWYIPASMLIYIFSLCMQISSEHMEYIMQSSFSWLASCPRVYDTIQLQETPPLLDQTTFSTLLLLLFSSYSSRDHDQHACAAHQDGKSLRTSARGVWGASWYVWVMCVLRFGLHHFIRTSTTTAHVHCLCVLLGYAYSPLLAPHRDLLKDSPTTDATNDRMC
jgi:hypothetical protein